MYNNKSHWYSSGMQNIFPDQVKVFTVLLGNTYSEMDLSMLHQHFREPLSEERWERLAGEIANFLTNNKEQEVYSFFYRQLNDSSLQSEWVLCSARVNETIHANKKEVVIFSYSLEEVDEGKRLYRVLENEEIFKAYFREVALLPFDY